MSTLSNNKTNSVEGFDKLAQKYQDKFMDLDIYNDTYDKFCKLLTKQNPNVFEIGTGPGNITRYLLSKRPDLRIKGIDLAPNMVQLARKNNPSASFTVMDCRNMAEVSEKYEAIVSGFCVPYLSKNEVVKFLKDCNYLLRSGGLLYFSLVEDEYQRSGIETSSDGQFSFKMHYYEAEFISNTLRECGFGLLELIRISYPKKGEELDVHAVFIARK